MSYEDSHSFSSNLILFLVSLLALICFGYVWLFILAPVIIASEALRNTLMVFSCLGLAGYVVFLILFRR